MSKLQNTNPGDSGSDHIADTIKEIIVRSLSSRKEILEFLLKMEQIKVIDGLWAIRFSNNKFYDLVHLCTENRESDYYFQIAIGIVKNCPYCQAPIPEMVESIALLTG